MNTNTAALVVDAKNRALRSFVQGLAVDLGVALLTVLVTIFGPVSNWGQVQWAIVSLTLVKTILQTVASYVARRFVDGHLNTSALLPPAPVPAPNEDQPVPPVNEGGYSLVEVALAVLLIVVAVYLILRLAG